jgi:CDP-4-dehydro-6-deoxyglucose reductase
MFKVLLHNKQEIYNPTEDVILNASTKQGVFLEHSCSDGRCGICKVQLLKGYVIDNQNNTFGPGDQILTCVCKPLSDIELDAEDLSTYGIAKPTFTPAKISKILKINQKVVEIEFRLPPIQKLNFLSGQYLNISKNGIKRSYSIASHSMTSTIKLLIKKVSGGKMSHYWFEEAKVNDIVQLEMPKGTFFLRNHEVDNLILAATGTGIAPFISMLEDPKNTETFAGVKRIFLFWGLPLKEDVFWQPSSRSNLEFITVLSRDNIAKRYVQDEILNLDLNWNSTAVYACGSDSMIQDLKQKLYRVGLEKNMFFSDAFIPTN